jgi:RND family efflux transporter MFP subunit
VTSQAKTHPPSTTPVVVSEKSRLLGGRWFWLLILFAVAAWGTWWWKYHAGAATPEPKHESDDATSDSGPVQVEIIHARKGGITRSSSQTGSVHAFESAELFAKTSGYLKELSVDIGDRVKEGQILAVIDNPELIEEVERGAAALAQAKATVIQAEARIKTNEADVKAAEAAVIKAKADVERYVSTRKFREKELARYRGLRLKEAVPQQIIDEEEEHLDSAIAAEHAAEAEVFAAQARVTSARATVDQAKADLIESKANVDVAASNLDKATVLAAYTKIMSPYNGVVTFRGFHRGAFIRSAEGGTEKPILTVARTDKVRVVTYVPDRDVPFTDVGDKARVTLDALPGQVFEGTVTRFAETEDVQSRTMRTEIDLENLKNQLREGMYGIATIILQESSENATIPTSCLTGRTAQGSASVFAIRGGKAHLTPVKTGVDDGLRVEILAGLQVDDAVVLNPALVGDGAPALALEPSPQPTSTATPR